MHKIIIYIQATSPVITYYRKYYYYADLLRSWVFKCKHVYIKSLC